MHMFSHGGYSMGGMHGLWWIFWVVLIGVIAFYGWGRSGEQRPPSRETPREVLQRRLADGQITPDEYEKRKALLDRDASSQV
jgi:putative membrane protein